MTTTHPTPPRAPLIALVLAVSMTLAALLGLSQSTASGATLAAPKPPTPIPVERFTWPLAPTHPVLRPFQPPKTPYGPGHRGVDLGGYLNEPVMAADSGLVLYAGPLADRSLVSIEHPGGLRTTYEPVQPTVRVGDDVRRGQVIGVLLAGHPGCPAVAPMVCLHWGAHRQRTYLDPLRLVESGRIRLLPWPANAP
ncbi:MAG TPA: M23 family metallopeptidase [Pseudonocardiaceae bacterium]|nr:M23 family metallopeptidase [Pseudonocardiaceae bacterium]